MASITINPIQDNKVSPSTNITGEEKVIIINNNGTRSTISVNLILDKVDDGIIDRIDDPILEKVEDQLDEMIEDRLENIDPNNNLKWNEVL